jgi:hypothetical protein
MSIFWPLILDPDDDKYTAHAGLLGRSIQSTPLLQSIDKALSNPQAVIQDLAGSNGQNCVVYKGSCVNLNDNNAIAKACGAGNTPIGWDDAGCGKKKYVSVQNRALLPDRLIELLCDSNKYSPALW